MKPYRSGSAVVLLVILASCTSVPPETVNLSEGRENNVPVYSQDAADISFTEEAGSGEHPEEISGNSGSDSPSPAPVVSWPSAPAAPEMPLPEVNLQNPAEPVPVFPSVIQVVEKRSSGLEENHSPEESSSLPVSAVPQTSREAVITGPPPVRKSETDDAGGAASRPVENNLSLPGWTTVESREEMVYFVSARDPHILILEGAGWTLKSSQGGHTNLERSLQPGATVFTFLLPQEGTGQLIFQRQDLSAKAIHLKTVFYRGENPPESYTADGIAEEALEEEASSEGLVLERENTADQVTERADPSGTAMEEGLDEPRSGEEETTALTLSEAEGFDSDALFNAAVRYYNSQDFSGLARVLDQLQRGSLPVWEQDRLLLFLGRLHDLDSPLRDERAALEYYSRLVEQYPGSLYWEEANRRARYIRRHFFQIR